MHDSIPFDAEWTNHYALEYFTGHRLYWIAPDFRDLHDHFRC